MIDIIIPNYNGVSLLPVCLDALRRQTRQDFQIMVVDDASTDDSVALLRQHYPEVEILQLTQNSGLAKAINQAITRTHGEYVVLLNNDTEAEQSWLAELVGALERQPEYAFAASKLRLYDRRDVLHSAGDGYAINGVPFNRGVWEIDRGQYDSSIDVFGPCAGAAAYRRAALDQLAIDGRVFDEDLFMYCEDVDLNIRAQLAGYRTIFVPTAVVYHKLSATGGGSLASYYCGRNFILVWSKNMPATAISKYFFAFFKQQLRITLDAVRHIRGAAARARLRGQLAGLRDLPQFIAKRRQIRQRQQLADAQFIAVLGK
ncbi:MAG TPA: glycosyltransferase family 2 protein [Herpetosiphonaceae bacterium]